MFSSRLIFLACFSTLAIAWPTNDGSQGASAIQSDDSCSNDQRDVIKLAWMDAMNMTDYLATMPPGCGDELSYHELLGPSDVNYSATIPGVFANMTTNAWKIAASCDLYDSSPACNDPYM